MNGELAEQMALVGWGNEILAGRRADDRLDDHGTFRYVRSVTFTASRPRRLRAPKDVDRVDDWFRDLRTKGTKRLELDAIGRLVAPRDETLAPHLSVAFANSSDRPILALGSGTAEVWGTSWSVHDGERPPDDRIWDVVHDRRGEIDDPRLVHPSVADASGALATALGAIHRFATEHDGPVPAGP